MAFHEQPGELTRRACVGFGDLSPSAFRAPGPSELSLLDALHCELLEGNQGLSGS